MRYIRSLERRDLGLDTSMIPLGSCTMKLNPATAMLPITWERFSRMHRSRPTSRRKATRSSASSRPRSARSPASPRSRCSPIQERRASTGLMVIRAYHHDRGESARDVVLIPASAHGTNPASAAMAGLRVVVASAPNGNVDLDDLRRKASQHRERLACLMITLPLDARCVRGRHSRHLPGRPRSRRSGAYGRRQHERTGRADQSGLDWRRRVCHLNLHKTFAIPHGGGGPGMGR